MERYNIRLSFKGEDSLKFVLGLIGEVVIYAGRDLYVKDASVSLIESLRGLKPLGLELTIGGKADGCFKTYDLSLYGIRNPRLNVVSEIVKPDVVTRSDVKDIITKTPDIDETIEDDKDPEEIVEDEKVIDNPEDLGEYIITTETSSAEGKKLKDLKVAQLRGLLRHLNEVDKEAVKKYLEK